MNVADQVSAFLAACKKDGFTPSVRGSIVTITATFTPGDNDAFVACDMAYYGVLSLVPLRGGSVWGTDGGGIGGAVALRDGSFRMNKSGTGAKFLKALSKALSA